MIRTLQHFLEFRLEDDKILVQRAQDGDQVAFRTLVERYQRKVYSICYGMLKNPEDSMDASQETFIKVYRYLEKFNFQSKFYTWLYRISVNVCIDHIRKNAKRKSVEYEDTIARPVGVGDENIIPSTLGLNPEKAYGRKELREKMLEALEKIPEKHRTILILREAEGLNYDEIADVLEISKGTVMSRLFHARRYFQEALSEYLGKDGSKNL